MPAESDYYAVLGVSPDSEDIVVQAAYRALMRRYHPDKNPSKEAQRKTLEINAAYAVLGDPAKRAAYDERRYGQSGSSDDQSSQPPPPRPPKGNPAEHAKAAAAWEARGHSGGLIFASIITVAIIVTVVISASNSTSSVGLNVMNVDENLTTTDMNAVDMNAVDMNAAAVNATDLNAVEAQLVPADLSKLPQTAVSYDTIEASAKRVAKFITTKGISGARAYSEGCHKSVQSTPSWDAADGCAAFDYAAAYIDSAVSTQNGWPKDGYFQFQNDNQPDDYAAVGAASYVTSDRLVKIRSAAQDAALDAFRIEVARLHADQPKAPPNSTAVTESNSE